MKFARLMKLGSLVGMICPLLFVVVVTGLSIVEYDFLRSLGWDPLQAPTFDWPSGLSLGPLGWLMTAAFIVSGAMMALFAFGLRFALQTQSGRLGSTLLMLAGLAMMGLAFTTDPTIRSTPATWHGRLHDLSFVLFGLTLLPAMIVLGFAFQRDEHWRNLAVYTWITAALAIPAFVVKGGTFYIFLLAMLAWSEMLATRLKNV